MFPGIDNFLGLEAVSEIIHNRESNFPSAWCILDAFKLFLECNNFVFNNLFYLGVDDTAIGPPMSFSCTNIAMCKSDFNVLNYKEGLLCGTRFRDDVFVLWK